ncbi:2-hydroxyacid dehydrogenase [Ensifer soli]|uniref:2-hydroxyacid dehydrogenase n=1 Tax=Ciceribacter sp. sgz301302 TaxID=3342379 RepID=UPI0035BA08D5
MQRLIALVTRAGAEAENAWLDRLRPALPDETIVPFRDLDVAARARVDIAIVANPDPAEVSALPNLVWIHSLWAGVERLVLELADLPVPIVRLVDPQLSATMAEAVLAWTYYLFRDMPDYARQQRERRWNPLPYRRAGDTTVSLLGLGTLGAAAAGRLIEAGFRVQGWSRTEKHLDGVAAFSGEEGLKAMLSSTDILVCLLPLTAQTRGRVDGAVLRHLPKGACLINFARGPVLVAPDLIAALDAGTLRHAVLDVFDVEPLPADDPFWAHPSVTVLPHISAPTDRDTAAAIVAGNIRAFRATGSLPATVDRRRGY